MKRKIIIDTDPGIDDAMAILLAFNAPQLQVMGLTTTFGNVPVTQATANALTLVAVAEMDVPVAQGVARPICAEPLPHPDFVHGSDGFGNIHWPASDGTPDGRSAARFIVDTVRAHPGEISIVTLGPLGNLAKALELDPGIITLVDEVIVMGGAAKEPGNVSPVAEANMINDPHAADRVFAAPWHVTMVGLDVTHQIMMDRNLLGKIRDSGAKGAKLLYQAHQFYLEFYHRSYGIDGCYIHDASAIACAMTDKPFTTEPGIVRVATEGVAMGQTIVAPVDKHYPLDYWQNRPHSKICMAVDNKRVLQLIEDTFTKRQEDHENQR